jgi:excisionase family DNA binding protein
MAATNKCLAQRNKSPTGGQCYQQLMTRNPSTPTSNSLETVGQSLSTDLSPQSIELGGLGVSDCWQELVICDIFSVLWKSEIRVMTDEILTLPEIAQLLKVGQKTLYTLAQKGELPAFKVLGQWRFKRVDIDRWIEQQKATGRNPTKSAMHETP